MKRMTNDELDARIHKFLYRKYTQFPELQAQSTQTYGLHAPDTARRRSPLSWSAPTIYSSAR